MKRAELNSIVKHVALLGQLGLSVLMPLLLCLAFCWYLNTKHNVGLWIYLIGFFFGIGSSFMTAYKFYQNEIQKEKKENKKKRVSFNRHV